jgi:argininosuccinate lyase
MEYLIGRGVPQRTAHGIVGKLVRKAIERGARLADLTLDEFQEADGHLDRSVYDVLGAERAVRAFKSYGSTAPEQVAEQLFRWQQKLSIKPSS